MIPTANELQDELLDRVRALPYEQQRRVLDFARSLASSAPQGIPGRELLSLAGSIDPDDLRLMADAIEEECEQIDPNEW